MRNGQAGQSLLEYLLILTLIILAILLGSGVIKTAVQTKLFPAAEGHINKASEIWKDQQKVP